MIVHDKDVGVVRLLDKDDAGCINCMPTTSGCASLDCKFSYEELLAAYQELKHELTRERSRSGNYKYCCKKARTQLDAKNEEVKRISRVAKSALSLDKEVQRLRALLDEVGVDRRKRSTIVSLRMEIGSLKNENAEMKKQVKNLLSNRKVLSNSLYGRRSEKQKRPPSGRRRGQQPGAPGHGRTARPDIEVVEESWYASEDELTCASCGKPYVANGKRSSEMYEIKIKAHKRKINKSRHCRACDCESSPLYVTASAPARLFKGTQYGISVWAQLIHERYWNLRPYRLIERCFSDHGFKISAGTLAQISHQ